MLELCCFGNQKYFVVTYTMRGRKKYVPSNVIRELQQSSWINNDNSTMSYLLSVIVSQSVAGCACASGVVVSGVIKGVVSWPDATAPSPVAKLSWFVDRKLDVSSPAFITPLLRKLLLVLLLSFGTEFSTGSLSIGVIIEGSEKCCDYCSIKSCLIERLDIKSVF